MSQWRVYFTSALVAGIVAVLATGGPAISQGVRDVMFARNADKVDGKHAVAASASLQARRGKLVATNRGSGLLPNNIIQKAPDSNLLDGLDSTDFLAATGKAADAELLDGLEATAFLAANGKAADAELLDGQDSSSFVTGGGTVQRTTGNVGPGATMTLTTALSTVTYACPANLGNAGSVSYSNNFAGLAPVFIDDGSSVAFARVGTTPMVASTAPGGDHLEIGGRHQLTPDRMAVVDVYSVHDAAFGVCTVTIQALVN